MDHPGVKTLLDRIFKQQKPASNVSSSSSTTDQSSLLSVDKQQQVSLKKFNEIELSSNSSSANNSTAASFTRLTDFKETLKQRMKARRCQIRKEEEEDNEMDEEYHLKKKKDEDEDESDELNNNKINKDVKTISDDEDEDENDESGDDDDDSDSDFKLNLNEDEDEENEEATKNNYNNNSKRVKKSATNKISCYDFDEEQDEEELPDLRSTKNKKDKEIPLTNSIPSNQLTKDNLLNYNEFSLMSQDDPDRIVLEGTQFLVANKQRRSLDELTNISFNYETASNHTNTTNTNHHTPNTTTTSTNQNSAGRVSVKSADNTLNDEVLFDELAMLCSGQFRNGGNTQKNKNSETKEIVQPIVLETVNDDLYAADEGEEYDNEIKNKKLLFHDDEDADSSWTNESASKSDEPVKKQDKNEKDNEQEPEEEEEPESSPEEIKEKKSKKLIAEEEEEKFDENKDEDLDDLLGDDDDDGSNDKKEKTKKNEINKPNEDEDDEEEGFIEKEAELSGSEEEDEDDDGNSDDNEILFSGDEDELPSDSELRQQLGKFYHKDQMDDDKRQIRMFKEMYLADGEMHSKEARRKQFRWKNIDETWGNHNNRSSSEEDEEDEEAEKSDSEENKDMKKKKSEEREKKYAKLIANRNWRLNRHEREQFVHAKLKSNNDKLLSDDEDAKNDDENEYSDNEDDDEDNTKMSSASTSSSSANQLLKKGQLLLKQSLQNKRTFNGEINNVNRPSSSAEAGKDNKLSATQQQNKDLNEKVDLMKKYSFLNRDKSYLNRISNLLSKNFTGSHVQHLSIGNAGGDFSGSVMPVSSIKSRPRTNNMVFSTVDNTCDNTASKTNNNRKQLEEQSKQCSNSTSSSPVVVPSLPKRTKYDTCESIFNHIS